MRCPRARLLVALCLGLSLCWPAAALARRYLVAVGQNLGAADDPQLRFAERDAERVAEVMLTVGGVDRADAALLFGAEAEQLAAALEEAGRRMRADGQPVDQLVVYISGHAADGMLHLGGSQYPIAALRRFVEEAPVSLAMLILDTCDAGRLTRKGLEALPPGPAVRVERPDAEGRVYIAASAAGEAAYESDRLEGALFTHHLTAGLRGAADRDHDGRVTLDEAFGYAYSGTLASTFGTRRKQTPSYAFDLRGEGAVVLTETRRAGARLSIDDGLAGEWIMIAPGSGETVRLSKSPEAVVLAVTPGEWRARRISDRVPVEARLDIAEGGVGVVSPENLEPVATGVLAARGAGVSPWSLAIAAELAPPVVDGGVGAVALGGALAARWIGHRWWGALDGAFRGAAEGDVSQREFEAGLGGGLAWRPLDPLTVRLGLRGGAALINQSGVPEGVRWSTVPRAGLLAAVEWPLWGPLHALVEARGGGQMVRGADGWRAGAFAAGSLGLSLGL